MPLRLCPTLFLLRQYDNQADGAHYSSGRDDDSERAVVATRIGCMISESNCLYIFNHTIFPDLPDMWNVVNVCVLVVFVVLHRITRHVTC